MNNKIKASAAFMSLLLLSIPLSGCNDDLRFESSSIDQLHDRHQAIHESLKREDQDEFRLAMMTLRLFAEEQTTDSAIGDNTSEHYLMGLLNGMSADEIMEHARQPEYQPYRLQAFHQLTYNARMKQQEHERLKEAVANAEHELAKLKSRQAAEQRGERLLSKVAVIDQQFSISDGLPTYNFVMENRTDQVVLSVHLWVSMKKEPGYSPDSGQTLTVRLPRPLAPHDTQHITLRVNRPEDRLHDDAEAASSNMTARVIGAETREGRLRGEPVALSVMDEHRMEELAVLIERLNGAIDKGSD